MKVNDLLLWMHDFEAHMYFEENAQVVPKVVQEIPDIYLPLNHTAQYSSPA